MSRGHDARKPGFALLATATTALAVVLSGCGATVVNKSDNLVNGKQLFVAKCGSCHVLSRAATKGNIGPNLDEAFQQSLSEGFGRSPVRGVVAHQISFPATGGVMPAELVKGKDVTDIAAYVATVAAKPGQDSGLLASAVKKGGGGKPTVAKNGTLEIDADPSGQLAYVTGKAQSPAGPVTLKMANKSTTPHNIAIEGNGATGAGKVVGQGGVSEFQAKLKPGTYTYFCQVPGHRQAGMLGKLTVK